ncbi:MAG: hypothetical protein ACYC7F_03235 [Gemmatimonadaceae bacterium]
MALLACWPSWSAAQTRIAVDLAVGLGAGASARDDHGGVTAEAAWNLYGSREPHSRFIAVALSADGFGPHGDPCRLIVSGDCLGPLTFRSLSALAGADLGGQEASVNVAAGPAVYVSSDHVTAGALQARVGLVAPARSPIAFVLAGRRAWLPTYRGEHYNVTAVTIGLRLQHRRAR